MQNRTINVWIKILFISGFAIVVVALLALPIQICYFGISSFDKNVFSMKFFKFSTAGNNGPVCLSAFAIIFFIQLTNVS